MPGVGEIIGEADDEEGETFWILHMETDPKFRRQGVNRALFRRLCQRFKVICPGVIVAACAIRLEAMMLREAAAAGVRVSGQDVNPFPEADPIPLKQCPTIEHA